MKKINYIITAFSVLMLSACTKDFEEINTNPNAPIDAQPSLLLRQVIYNYGEEMSYEGFVAGNLLGQNLAMIDFNLFDRHNLSSPQLGGNPWPVLYKNLRDNQIILQKSGESAVFKVYEGPALILKAYMGAALTDIYGDVPFFEALNGKSGNTTPKYDSQEAIYTADDGVLDLLDQGIAALQNYTGAARLEGDVLFNGDLDSWIKFGNSLKIKYLMRISDRVNVSTELQTIFTAGNYIQFNVDNATYDFTSGPPNNFRMATLRSGDFNQYVMSLTSEEILKRLNDPRIEVLFRSRSGDTSGTTPYVGILNGPDLSNTISVADYSLPGTIFRENTGVLDANFMTAWETSFLLAEAAQKGLIGGNAQLFYETGVRQAFEYWNTALPSNYLTTDSAAFGASGANPLEQISTQKWIANTINGYENWIEFRRTGFPQLKTVAASLNGNAIPVRMPYPAGEQTLNSLNYGVAAGNTNGNSVNVKTWWDAN